MRNVEFHGLRWLALAPPSGARCPMHASHYTVMADIPATPPPLVLAWVRRHADAVGTVGYARCPRHQGVPVLVEGERRNLCVYQLLSR